MRPWLGRLRSSMCVSGGWPPKRPASNVWTLEQDSAGILSLGLPGASRSTGACADWMASASSPPFIEAGEAIVWYIGGGSGRVLLLIETLLYVIILTCHFQFSTHKSHIGSDMRPLPMASSWLLSPATCQHGSSYKVTKSQRTPRAELSMLCWMPNAPNIIHLEVSYITQGHSKSINQKRDFSYIY